MLIGGRRYLTSPVQAHIRGTHPIARNCISTPESESWRTCWLGIFGTLIKTTRITNTNDFSNSDLLRIRAMYDSSRRRVSGWGSALA